VLDPTIYNKDSMDLSFPTVYFKTSSVVGKAFPTCIQYNDDTLKLSATAVIFPILFSYFAVGMCCLCVSLLNPLADKAGSSYDDFQARQEARRRAVAAEQEGARKIAHRIAATTDVRLVGVDNMDNKEVTMVNPFNASNAESKTRYPVVASVTSVSPTAPPMAVMGHQLTPKEQFQAMTDEINSWSGDTLWMCDILTSLSGLIRENPILRDQALKLSLINVCKRKRMDYPEQWDAQVAALFGQCLGSFSFMGSIGLTPVPVPTKMLSNPFPDLLQRARSLSIGGGGGGGGGGVELQPQTRANSVEMK
jgi:hypothetical protein